MKNKTPLGSISVGTVHKFDCLTDDGDFAVYRKRYMDDSDRATYVITRLPSVVAYTEPPFSVLAEFDNREEALATFQPWKLDKLSIRPLTPSQKRKSGPAQREFNFGHLKSREQVEFDALRKRLGGAAQ